MKQIPNLKFRQIKLLLRNGRWIKNTTPICHKADLKKFLKEHSPLKAYMTASLWLADEELEGKRLRKGTYKTLNHCFMGSDLVFDFDKKKSWNQVQRDTITIYNHMKQLPEYTFSDLRFSGSRGLHLEYTEKQPEESDPKKRVEFFNKQREKLLNSLPPTKTLDRDLLKNIYNVYKIPGTYDFSTGYKVQEIDIETFLNTDIFAILGSLRRTNCRGNDANSRHNSSVVGKPEALSAVPGQGYRANYLYKFITNKVPGVRDMYVPFLLLKKGREVFSADKYNLDPLYVLDYGGRTALLSLKPVSKARLNKILKAYNAMKYNQFLRKGFCKIRTSQLLFDDGRVLPQPEIIAETIGRHKIISKAHHNFIESLGGYSGGKRVGTEFKYIVEGLVRREAEV